MPGKFRGLIIGLAVASAALTGCPRPTVDAVSPATATQFGHVEVTITGANFQAGAKVFVGGVEALFVDVLDANTISATVQGAPVPGPADVMVVNPDNGGGTAAGIFTYTPPTDPLFERVVGLGASYSAGIQSNSFAGRAQLTGPLAHLMQAAGAYFPLPITKGAGLPPLLGPDSVVVSDGSPLVHPITGQIVNVPAGQIFNPAENINSTEILLPYILDQILPEVLANPFQPPLFALRETGSVRASNISVPAGLMSDTIMGERFGISALAWAIIDPTKDLVGSIASLAPSPLKEIAERDPTLVVSTDLYGIDVALRGDIPLDTFRSFLFYILLDLATSNYYTAPGAPAEWPGVPFKRKDTGETVYNPFNEADYDEYELVIDYETLGLPNLGDLNGNERIDESEVDLAAVFAADDPSDNPQAIVLGTIPTAPEIFDGPIIPSRNAAALALAELFPNVYMFDSATLIEPILDEARGVAPPDVLDVDDDGDLDVYLHEFGGVRSLDGLHLTATGYAFLANIFIQQMNATLGTTVPEIDLAAIFATDPLAPCNYSPEVRAIVGTPEENCP